MVLMPIRTYCRNVYNLYRSIHTDNQSGKNYFRSYSQFQKGLASLHRIKEITLSDEKIIEQPDAKPISSFKKHRFNNVCFI